MKGQSRQTLALFFTIVQSQKSRLREDLCQRLRKSADLVPQSLPLWRPDPKHRLPWKSGAFSAARIVPCWERGPARPALSRRRTQHRSLSSTIAFCPRIIVFPQPLKLCSETNLYQTAHLLLYLLLVHYKLPLGRLGRLPNFSDQRILPVTCMTTNKVITEMIVIASPVKPFQKNA